MREKLFVRFPDTPDDGLQWVILSPEGDIQSSVTNGTFEQLLELIPQRRIIAFAPGQFVTLTQTQLPTTNRGKMLAAVPYAVEDELISDVDALHFAIGNSASDNGDVPVAVIDQSIISEWTEKLHDHDITIDELIPDTMAVPFTPDGWTIVITDHSAIVRTSECQGFSADIDTLDITLKLAVKNATKTPEQIRVLNFTGSEIEIPEIEDVEVSALHDDSHYLMQLLANHYSDVNHINLLQGEFSRASQTLKMIMPWWPAAAIFVVWVGISMINMSIEFYDLRSQNIAYAKQQDDIFKKAFPDKRVVAGKSYDRMKKAWEKEKLAAGGSDTNDPVFLALLDGIGSTLKNTPGLDLSNLSFRAGVLNLELSLNNLQDLENLRTKLESTSGTKIEVVNVRSEGKRVLGRLRVQKA